MSDERQELLKQYREDVLDRTKCRIDEILRVTFLRALTKPLKVHEVAAVTREALNAIIDELQAEKAACKVRLRTRAYSDMTELDRLCEESRFSKPVSEVDFNDYFVYDFRYWRRLPPVPIIVDGKEEMLIAVSTFEDEEPVLLTTKSLSLTTRVFCD